MKIGFETRVPILREVGLEIEVAHLPGNWHLNKLLSLHQHLPVEDCFRSGRQTDPHSVTFWYLYKPRCGHALMLLEPVAKCSLLVHVSWFILHNVPKGFNRIDLKFPSQVTSS